MFLSSESESKAHWSSRHNAATILDSGGSRIEIFVSNANTNEPVRRRKVTTPVDFCLTNPEAATNDKKIALNQTLQS